MMKRLALLSGMAAGYVLGAKAGREQYEKIREKAMTFWENPKVQEQVSTAQQVVKEKAPVVQEKVSGAAKKKSSGSGDDSSDATTGGFGAGSEVPAADEGSLAGPPLGEPPLTEPPLGAPPVGEPPLGEPRRPEPGSGI